MKKMPFGKREIMLTLFHLIVFMGLALCFLKFPEEIIELKNQVRVMRNPEMRDLDIDFSEYPNMENSGDEWYYSEPLIYHAAGEVGGLDYTNSKEAMELTLEAGHRFVEIDFLYTSDHKLACAHYWDSLWLEESEAPTYEEFKELPIFGKYTAMTAEDLIRYMVEYPDLHIVVDTKEYDYIGVVRDLVELSSFDTSITERLIIQLYEADTKAKFQEMYPFKDENFLFTIYKYNVEHVNRIMNICYEENISVVAIPFDIWDQETIEMFRSKGFILYEYTVNRPNMARRSMERGISGFYTDCLTESDLQGPLK